MSTPDPTGTPAMMPGTPAAGRPLSAAELAQEAAEAVRAGDRVLGGARPHAVRR